MDNQEDFINPLAERLQQIEVGDHKTVSTDQGQDLGPAAARNPLSFHFWNCDSQPALSSLTPEGEPMILRVTNQSAGTINLDPQTGNGRHFSLNFRKGTLKDLENVTVSDGDWQLTRPGPQDDVDPQVDTFFLTGTSRRSLAPGQELSIKLESFYGDPERGTRNTQVMLGYQNLIYAANGAAGEIKGYAEQTLSVVHQMAPDRIAASLKQLDNLPKKCPPLTATFADNDTILSDLSDGSHNFSPGTTLTIQVTNTSKDQALILSRGSTTTRFSLSFTVAEDVQSTAWALCRKGEINANAVQFRGPDGQPWNTDDLNTGALIFENGMATAEWISPPKGGTITPGDVAWPPGHSLVISLSGISTGLPAGAAPITIGYEDLPGFENGELVIIANRAPLLFSQNNQDRAFDLKAGDLFVSGKVDTPTLAANSLQGHDDQLAISASGGISTDGQLRISRPTTTTSDWQPTDQSTSHLILRSTTVSGTVNIDFRTYSSDYPTARIAAVDSRNYSAGIGFYTKKPGADANELERRLSIGNDGKIEASNSVDAPTIATTTLKGQSNKLAITAASGISADGRLHISRPTTTTSNWQPTDQSTSHLILQSTTVSGTVNIDFRTYSSDYPTARIAAVDSRNYSAGIGFYTKKPGANANGLEPRLLVGSSRLDIYSDVKIKNYYPILIDTWKVGIGYTAGNISINSWSMVIVGFRINADVNEDKYHDRLFELVAVPGDKVPGGDGKNWYVYFDMAHDDDNPTADVDIMLIRKELLADQRSFTTV